MPEAVSAYRNTTYRLLPGSRSNAKHLAGLAGACSRFVWNAILAEQSEAYKKAKEAGEKPPSVSFFSLGKRFTVLRRTVEWLPDGKEERRQRVCCHLLQDGGTCNRGYRRCCRH